MNFLFTIICSLLLFGCQKSSSPPHNKQEIRLNLHSEPPTLDPRKATDVTSINVIRICFEGLMRMNPQGAVDFALAERVDVSEDKKKYTFYLRKAFWSDGEPITAFDFETTWKTILDPAFPSEFAFELYVIKNGQAAREKRVSSDKIGVKALNDRTLSVELEYSAPHFLNLISSPFFFATPSHLPSAFPQHRIGSGPFILTQWKHYNQIVLEKNPFYWDAENVSLEKITLFMVEDESTELAMYESGELDWAGHPLSRLPLDALQALEKKSEMHRYPLSGTYYYIFNTQAFPFNNKNMRRAFALAIDRQSIIDNILQEKQKPALAFVPFTMWEEEQIYFKDNDQAEAKRLFQLALQELKIKKEDFPAITLSYNTSSAHNTIAQAIQEQWTKTFGIRIKVENKEWKVFLDELGHHNFQVARMGGIAAVNDPTDFLDVFRYAPSRRNHSGWSNPKFQEILESAKAITDEKKRKAHLREAEKILMDEMPIAPIYYYVGSYMKKPYLQGVTVSDMAEIDLKSAKLLR